MSVFVQTCVIRRFGIINISAAYNCSVDNMPEHELLYPSVYLVSIMQTG